MNAPKVTLRRVIILCGEDPDLKREFLERLRQKISESGSHEWLLRNASQSSLSSLLNEAGTGALFTAHTILVVEEADRILKRRTGPDRKDSDPIALLKHFAAQVSPPCTLVLVTSLHPKAVGALSFCEIVACWPLEDREGRPELTRWTLARARSRNGKTLEPDAAEILLARTGNVLSRIADALETLALYVGDRPSIKASDVEALVGPDPQIHAFALAEATALGDAPRALGILRHLLDSGERAEAIQPALAFHFRRLCQAIEKRDGGIPSSAAAAAIGVKPMFQAPFLNALDRLSLEQGQGSLRLLMEADRRLKHGEGQSVAALERAVVNLCRLSPQRICRSPPRH
jgi:DNA polymerase-3 subunit delta